VLHAHADTDPTRARRRHPALPQPDPSGPLSFRQPRQGAIAHIPLGGVQPAQRHAVPWRYPAAHEHRGIVDPPRRRFDPLEKRRVGGAGEMQPGRYAVGRRMGKLHRCACAGSHLLVQQTGKSRPKVSPLIRRPGTTCPSSDPSIAIWEIERRAKTRAGTIICEAVVGCQFVVQR